MKHKCNFRGNDKIIHFSVIFFIYLFFIFLFDEII